jgi:hypothetical protein
MTDIFSAYELLQEFDLCDSEITYSVEWLGRSKSYLAYLRSSRNYPKMDALIHLAGKLLIASNEIAAAKRQTADTRRQAARLREAATAIMRLALRQAMAFAECTVMRSDQTPPATLADCAERAARG